MVGMVSIGDAVESVLGNSVGEGREQLRWHSGASGPALP